MPNWKKVVVSGSDAALNSLHIKNDLSVSGSTRIGNSTTDSTKITGSVSITGSLSLKGYLYDNLGTTGTPDQILFRSATGGIEWRDNIANSAQDLIITGKNVGLTTIQKGTPVFFTGSGVSGQVVGLLPADAGNINRMPAGGVAGESIAAGAEGDVFIYGFIKDVNTSAFNSGDDVFVAVGGGYTNVKPTGSALIQKLGNVEKVSVSNGSGVINGPSWYNDLPNWEVGRIMVGRSNGQPVTSSFIYVNETTDTFSITGALTVSSSLYQWNQNADVDTGTETVISIATGSYRSAFFDYVVTKTTNARSGTVFAVWNGTTVEFTETSTNDIGSTSDLILRASINGANVLLQATALSDNWSVKTLARLL